MLRRLNPSSIAARGVSFCLLIAAASSVGAQQPKVAVTLVPATPLIEPTAVGNALNFDMLVRNGSGVELELTRIRIAARDAAGRIAKKVEINENGVAPGIATVVNRKIDPGSVSTIFNPLHTFAADVPLDQLDVELVFADPEGRLTETKLLVKPERYRQRTRLTLPISGRLLVWDGHDYYAHHRRLDYFHPVLKSFGWQANSSRYSLDLATVDAEGRMHGPSDERSGYFGYGATVLAPGAGIVVAAVGDEKEGADPDLAALANPAVVLGNRIVIDHGNGEYSHLGHLLPGSLQVRVGERVRAGQPIARVGSSGWSIFPHLHYELTRSADMRAEGLPALFSNYRRVLGSKRVAVPLGAIDSGDIVEAETGAKARR